MIGRAAAAAVAVAATIAAGLYGPLRLTPVEDRRVCREALAAADAMESAGIRAVAEALDLLREDAPPNPAELRGLEDLAGEFFGAREVWDEAHGGCRGALS